MVAVLLDAMRSSIVKVRSASRPSRLWQCYVAAIPFFRHTLLGNLVYVTALFGTFALITVPRVLHQEANPR